MSKLEKTLKDWVNQRLITSEQALQIQEYERTKPGGTWILLLISLRFIVLYFQALGGLATTGGGLIASGILIIGIAFLWHKYRKRLATWAERLTQ